MISGTATAGTTCLVASILIFSSNSAVFTLLQAKYAMINPCNTLCGSSLIGVAVLTPYFWKDLSIENIRRFQRQQWLALGASTLLYSVFGPLLFYYALTMISVPAVAILLRLESLEFLLVSWWFLAEKVDQWSFVNAGLTLAGIVIALLSPPLFGQPLEFGLGHLFVILSGICYTASLFITKHFFHETPIGLVTVFRVSIGAIVFMLIQAFAMKSDLGVFGYGTGLFWANILWYGAVYVALGEILFLVALIKADPTVVSVGTTSLFVLTILWSMAIQQELPTGPQALGSAFITASVISSIAREIVLARNNKSPLSSCPLEKTVNEPADGDLQVHKCDACACGTGRL